MFICKKCGTKRRKLTPKDNKCKKCGSKDFTTPQVERAKKILHKTIEGHYKIKK